MPVPVGPESCHYGDARREQILAGTVVVAASRVSSAGTHPTSVGSRLDGPGRRGRGRRLDPAASGVKTTPITVPNRPNNPAVSAAVTKTPTVMRDFRIRPPGRPQPLTG